MNEVEDENISEQLTHPDATLPSVGIMNEDVEENTLEQLSHPDTGPVHPSTEDCQGATRELASANITMHFVV